VRKLTLEKLLIVSLIIGSIGAAGVVWNVWDWYSRGFPSLDYQVTMRRLVPSLTMVMVAMQGVFNGFMLSILFLAHGKKPGQS
jgi:uncharacterized membrane-anchored protein YitT (DUF2179 family)